MQPLLTADACTQQVKPVIVCFESIELGDLMKRLLKRCFGRAIK